MSHRTRNKKGPEDTFVDVLNHLEEVTTAVRAGAAPTSPHGYIPTHGVPPGTFDHLGICPLFLVAMRIITMNVKKSHQNLQSVFTSPY